MSTVKLPKTFLFQAIQFIQTVLIQLIKFSMLDIKTVLYITIQLNCTHTKLSKTFLFQAIQFSQTFLIQPN